VVGTQAMVVGMTGTNILAVAGVSIVARFTVTSLARGRCAVTWLLMLPRLVAPEVWQRGHPALPYTETASDGAALCL
jgi:hypothetical protein